MKRLVLLLVLCMAGLSMFAAQWELVSSFGGKPLYSQLEVYRAKQNITYKYIYDYRDSTFHIQIYPDARVLATLKNMMDSTPARPAYVEVQFRFKGCSDGDQLYSYHLTDPDPDSGQIVMQGYIDNVVKDDGEILSHLRTCKKMGLRYWSPLTGSVHTLELTTKGFEENRPMSIPIK